MVPDSSRGAGRRSGPFPIFVLAVAAACGGGDEQQQTGGRGGGRGGPGGFGGPPAEATAIPVQVAEVERRTISDYLQTTGALEADSEVDIVSRTSGPIVALHTEEGRTVQRDQLLAEIDDRELQAELELARVSAEETRNAFERAQRSYEAEILSAEDFEAARARYDTALAQVRSREIQLSYTEIRAPFTGRIIERAIKLGEFVSNGTRLFRISDFDPLLCPIQVPEKDLAKVRSGQDAIVRVEAFPGETFDAAVLRINPVIDVMTGTFKVTLEVEGRGKLRPGMFASVLLEVDSHENALVIPKRALVLEGVGDTVYVFEDGVARRREVELGFEEANDVEVVSGLSGDEQVIVLGQDSLTEGTPVYLLDPSAPAAGPPTAVPPAAGPPTADGAPGPPGPAGSPMQSNGQESPEGAADGDGASRPAGFPSGRPQIDWDDPEQVERVRERLRSRGLGDEQIDGIIDRMKSGGGPGGPRRDGSGADTAGDESGADGE